MFLTLDEKDIFYSLSGMIFLALATFPILKATKLLNAPIFFIAFGAILSYMSFELPLKDIQSNYFERRIFEHFTELIVIISLAGAGLAIDRRIGFKNWQHTWILLFLVMPITILSLFILGYYVVGLSIPSAFLLAAVLSPTDPVLARSVQVDGPNKGEENDVNVSLTSEAGLNDGLAFPFVYFALALAGINNFDISSVQNIATGWFAYDFFYRIMLGIIIGLISGYILSKIITTKYEDADKSDENAGLLLLASVFLTYGITEILDGYGFLGVFIAALVGKRIFHKQDKEEYIQLPHLFSDQFEKILMALLLVWIGYYTSSGILTDLIWVEILTAIALIFLIRPFGSTLSLLPSNGSRLDHFAISFLGIRGIGSLYYLIYAQNNGSFDDIESIWRITLVTIILSVIIHGISSNIIMKKIHARS